MEAQLRRKTGPVETRSEDLNGLVIELHASSLNICIDPQGQEIVYGYLHHDDLGLLASSF